MQTQLQPQPHLPVVLRRHEAMMPRGVQPPQRPVSLYDNLKNGVNGYGLDGGAAASASSVGNLHSVSVPPCAGANMERARTPSQANCLSTTVPQNIAPQGFSSRHAPTRSSLRHSRMIVLTREGRVPHKYQPAVFRKKRLGTALMALVLVLGAIVTAVASWLLVWAPRLPARDIPIYSGPPLVLVGILGLILLGCCRKDYPGRPYACCMFTFKMLSVTFTAVAGMAALCASAFAVLHLVSLQGSSCEPPQQLNATCTCRPNVGGTLLLVTREYLDLNCPEVESILSLILIASFAANGISGVLCVWYVFLHWSNRYTNVYSKVRTSDVNPIVISNNKT